MLSDFVTLVIGKQKKIALIAHDGKKQEMLDWCEVFPPLGSDSHVALLLVWEHELVPEHVQSLAVQREA